VPEVADAGEDHGDAQAVGRRHHFGIAHAPAGLNEGGGAVLDGFLDAIGEGEKASEATTVPATGSTAFMAPSLTESTRLICPAPTPTVCPARA
jgi:hypothetical protein